LDAFESLAAGNWGFRRVGGGDFEDLPPQPQKIREQPISPGNARRELAEKGETGVDVGSLPQLRDQQTAAELRAAGIGDREERHESWMLLW
jgi:hypothetical protein